MLPCRVQAVGRPMNLTSHAGLTLVVETLMAARLDDVVRATLQIRRRKRGFDEYDKLQALVLLLTAGGECVEDVKRLRDDEALARLIGRSTPAPDGLHDFLRAFHAEAELLRRPASGAFIPQESAALSALGRVNDEWIRRVVGPSAPTVATLDLDATVIESYKEEALPNYLGSTGYQPTLVVWAEEDLIVADQFRDGNVPAGLRTQEVAARAFAALPATVKQRFFRADSACYDARILKWLCREEIQFTISASMSRELSAACRDPALRWQVYEDRKREVVALTEVEFTSGNWPKKAPPLRYVALRFSGKQGRLFSDGNDTKYLAVVSNRRALPAADLIEWHWQKAGTIEHVHDTMKNDLATRLMPSKRFGANAAWHRINVLTYNVLTTLKRNALPARFRQARPKRLRFEVFTLPAVLTEHARQVTAQLGASPLAVDELIAARARLIDLHAAIGSFLDEKIA